MTPPTTTPPQTPISPHARTIRPTSCTSSTSSTRPMNARTRIANLPLVAPSTDGVSLAADAPPGPPRPQGAEPRPGDSIYLGRDAPESARVCTVVRLGGYLDRYYRVHADDGRVYAVSVCHEIDGRPCWATREAACAARRMRAEADRLRQAMAAFRHNEGSQGERNGDEGSQDAF